MTMNYEIGKRVRKIRLQKGIYKKELAKNNLAN